MFSLGQSPRTSEGENMKIGLRSVICFAFVALCSSSARASTVINFDTDANGIAITAPAAFVSTSPLTNLYSSLGVTFSGPVPGEGGAILDQLGNFGVNARSGNNFLAFNPAAVYPLPPETITFGNAVDSVSIYVSGGLTNDTFTLSAYNSSNLLVASDIEIAPSGAYVLLSTVFGGGISYVTLSTVGDQVFVADDLTIGNSVSPAAPLPSTAVCGLALMGVVGMARIARRQTRVTA
jgi:hypothetical protein